MSSARPDGDKAWNYLRIPSAFKKYILMDPIGTDVYECVILDGFPSKVASNSDDPPNSFRTRDTFIPHPTIPSAWRHVGRLDDRVTLMNGEKVLPMPIEGRIKEEIPVKECVVFGIGKAAPGLLLFRSSAAKGLSDDDFIERVMPAIQDANSRTESHSQISRDMIVVTDRDYPQTDKSTPIRARVYEEFAEEIEDVYSRTEGLLNGTVRLEVPELRKYLVELFRSLGVHIQSIETDLFSAGLDSVRALTALGKLKRELDLNGNAQKISQNIIFERSNISSLAQYLYILRTDRADEDDMVHDELKAMSKLVKKYSAFPLRDCAGVSSYPETHSVVSSNCKCNAPRRRFPDGFCLGPHWCNRLFGVTSAFPTRISSERFANLVS